MRDWLAVDPLADIYHGLSPYNYTENNPIVFLDPDGKQKWPSSDPFYAVKVVFGTVGTGIKGAIDNAKVVFEVDLSFLGVTETSTKIEIGFNATAVDNTASVNIGNIKVSANDASSSEMSSVGVSTSLGEVEVDSEGTTSISVGTGLIGTVDSEGNFGVGISTPPVGAPGVVEVQAKATVQTNAIQPAVEYSNKVEKELLNTGK